MRCAVLAVSPSLHGHSENVKSFAKNSLNTSVGTYTVKRGVVRVSVEPRQIVFFGVMFVF